MVDPMSDFTPSLSIPSYSPLLPEVRWPVSEPSSHQYLRSATVEMAPDRYVRMRQLFGTFKAGATPPFFKAAGVDAYVHAATPGGESFPDGTKWSDLTLSVSNNRGNVFEIVLTEGRKSMQQPIKRTLEVRGGGIFDEGDMRAIADKLQAATL